MLDRLLLKLLEHLLLFRDCRAGLKAVSVLLSCIDTGRWDLRWCWDASLALVSHVAHSCPGDFWLILVSVLSIIM